MRRPNRRPNYTEMEDITNWEETAAYLIHIDGSQYIAVNGDTGKEDSRSTDAYVVIQYCIDTLDTAETGGVVFIKSGTYYLSAGIVFNSVSGVHLLGEGMADNGTKLFLNDSVDEDVILITTTGAIDSSFNRISNMLIFGNDANNTTGHGIHAVSGGGGGNVRDNTIDHVYVSSAAETGIYFENGWHEKLLNILTENCGTHGIHWIVSNGHIIDVFTAYNGVAGFFLEGINNMCLNTSSYSNDSFGMDIVGVQNILTNLMCVKNNQGNSGVVELRIKGNYTVASNIYVEEDATKNTYMTLQLITGDYIQVSNATCIGADGVNIHVSATDCSMDNVYSDTGYTNAGPRGLMNGLSNNVGIPGGAGDWSAASREGVIVRDTTNNKTYIYADAGWREISAA